MCPITDRPSHSLDRRTLLVGSASLAAALTQHLGHTGAQGATPAPSPADAATASLDALTQTPVGEQLAWLLAAINDGGATLTEADVAEHVSPAFLAVIPPAQLIGLIQQLASGYGTLTLQGVTRPPTATQAVALVSATVGLQLALPIAIEADPPHRIAGLTVYPSPPGDGKPLQPATGDGVAISMNSPLVDIGGRGLYLTEAGTGEPTVLFEAGLGDSAATWAGVIPAVAAFANVLSYDRPNTNAGASDPAPMPRTADDVVADLDALLGAATKSGPYVLVGHSVGGIFARLYASRSPDQVAGLVLVDASHEEQDQRRQAMVSADLFAAEQQAVNSNSEGIDLAASFAQMSAAAPLAPMPLVVLSAGVADPAFFPPGWPMEEEAKLHAELQADLAGLVPNGRLVVAEQSGHYIQQTQPDLIVAAIHDVVQAVRNPSTWTTPTA